MAFLKVVMRAEVPLLPQDLRSPSEGIVPGRLGALGSGSNLAFLRRCASGLPRFHSLAPADSGTASDGLPLKALLWAR